MKRDEFDKAQVTISVTAGKNQRIHQILSSRWLWWNRFVQITVAVLAAIGACFSVAAIYSESATIDYFALIFAGSAAFLAILLNVLPIGDFARLHLDLFRRWTDLREDIDAIRFDQKAGEPRADLVARLKHLDAKVHRACGAEPALSTRNEKLGRMCENAERRSRGLPLLKEPDAEPSVGTTALASQTAV